jgi:hypothetical protein
MIKNELDSVLENANKIPSTEEIITKIYGKSKDVKPKSLPAKKKRKKMKQTLPDGFPKDTMVNGDGTLTLPDGRMVRKIQGAEDEQIQTA